MYVFVLGGGDWTRLGSEKRQGGKGRKEKVKSRPSPL